MKRKIAFAAVILLIWFHSCLPPSLSHEESGFFRHLLMFFFGPNVTELFVRKLAHFVEYTVLGIVLIWSGAADAGSAADGKHGGLKVALSIGLLVAFMDETLQIFSGRGSAIQDVWLDLAGVLCGYFFGRWIFSCRGYGRP